MSDSSTTEPSRKQPENSSMTTREKHLQLAPVLPFDSDLKYWESDKIEFAASYKSDSLHRFWKTNEHQESFVPSEVEASMRERSFRLERKFEPVTRKCGALLPSGRFCERMDRKVCPFHGKIVERDASGQPLHFEDIQRVSSISLCYYVEIKGGGGGLCSKYMSCTKAFCYLWHITSIIN